MRMAQDSEWLILRLKKRDTNFLSCANQVSIQTGKGYAFMYSQIQVGSIVNGEAVLICQREHSVIRNGSLNRTFSSFREARNSSASGLLIRPRRKPTRTLLRIS